MRKDLDERGYFFDEGLRFECQQCGACCTGTPGLVIATETELAAIAEVLETTPAAMLAERLAYKHYQGFRLHEHANGDCVFFGANGCAIYDVRPTQCRTWPFWFRLLRSEQNWEEAARECPGIGQGRLYTKEEIFAFLQR